MEKNIFNLSDLDLHELTEYQKTNREKKLTPKKAKFWCWHCDGALIGESEKCPNCGLKSGKRVLKRDR